MDGNIHRAFILNNCLAAVSAVANEASTLATDGFECRIHNFDIDGRYTDCTQTTRAYRRLRRDASGNGYTATANCNAEIYFMNENFIETGYTRLNTSQRNSCGCGSLCELTDASTVRIGDERFLVGAFRNSAYLFDTNGRRLTRLCETESGEILTDFVYSGNDLFALSSICGRNRTVTVSCNGNLHTACLGNGHTLRMLYIENGEVFGLFGQSYIYNRIYKIYSNGVLSLPT